MSKRCDLLSCKMKEILGVILLFTLFYLAYSIYQYRSRVGEIMESYESYDKNIESQKADAVSLSVKQKSEVESIFQNMIPKSVNEYVNANKSFLKGPMGATGPMGQSGGNFIEHGFLINKAGSYDANNKVFSNPNRALTRTSGNDPKTSLSFLDGFSPFSTTQKWKLDSNNNLMSEFDQSCVAFNPATGNKDKAYMSTCNDTSSLKLQKDKFSRLMVSDSLGTPAPKCLTLGSAESQVLTTGLPTCTSGNDCFKVGFGKQFLKVENCDLNVPKDHQIWSFL